MVIHPWRGISSAPYSERDKAGLVPVQGELVLRDEFAPTPEKQQHVRNTNELFNNRRTREALKELRLGEIELSYNRVWMPLTAASRYRQGSEAHGKAKVLRGQPGAQSDRGQPFQGFDQHHRCS